MEIAVLLGFLQGLVEWLPVSSEGVVSATYTFLSDRPFSEAVNYALWLHLGTVPSVLVVFHKEVKGILREVVNKSATPSPLLSYLLISTVVSAAVGLPLLLALHEMSSRVGAAAMALVGVLMLVTGAVQLRRREDGFRERNDISSMDALLTGIVQGLAVLPGLSRSGMTMAMLLARKVSRREALVLSFLMSVPASLGAALFVLLDSGLALSRETAVATLVAFVVGLITIRFLLSMVQRINFAWFVVILGLVILISASLQALI